MSGDGGVGYGGHASSLQVSRGKASIDCREPERVEYLASSTPSAALNHFHPNWVRHPPLLSPTTAFRATGPAAVIITYPFHLEY